MRRDVRRKSIAAVGLLLGLALLAPSPAAAEEGGGSAPRWGLAVRAGYFGLPDLLLDRLFEEHPSVDGSIKGAELRFFGSGGSDGAVSLGFSFDVGRTEGEGLWQEDAGSTPVVSGGEVDLAAAAVTLYYDFWASAPLHPYIGLGLGVGWLEGTYSREGEEVPVEEFVPVIHIPLGLLLKLGDHFALAGEARVIDGISFGGFLQVRF